MQPTTRSLLLIPLLVAILAVAGCGGGDDPAPTPTIASSEASPIQPASGATPVEATTDSENTTESTTSDTGGAAVAGTGNAAVDAVAAALRNQLASLPMRITMTDDEGSVTTAEIASPSTMRIRAEDMEMIAVEGTVYFLEDGVWTESPGLAGMVTAFAGSLAPEDIQEQVDMIVSAEQLPDEEVNGEAVSVYRFTVVSPDGDDAEAQKIHVRKSDGLPVRLSDEGVSDESFLVEYEYDPSIVIEAPQ